MLKIASIAISFLILFQGFNIHMNDIVELDELIEHAQFHSQEYGDNFFVFISKHYGELKAEHNQKHQEEKQEHEELPFQHQCQNASLSAFVINDIPDYPIVNEMSLRGAANHRYRASNSLFEKEGPFQPPRQS